MRRHAQCRTDREVIHTHQLADERAHRLGLGRELQPFIEPVDFSGGVRVAAGYVNGDGPGDVISDF